MEQRMTGTFYGVSVGPGDPELLTLQAVRLLRQCPVLAAPQTASGQMLALDIARRALGSRAGRQDHSAPAVCHEPGRRRAARFSRDRCQRSAAFSGCRAGCGHAEPG